MGAVGYLRVSTLEQASINNSLPVQQKKFEDHCTRNTLAPLDSFVDKQSGRNAERPAFQRMLAYCRKNKSRWNLQSFGGEFFCVALPTLRRDHDRGSGIYGCGIIHMHLLRFVVARASLLLLRCAPAHRRIRVPIPRRHTPVPRSAHTSEGTCDALSHHHAIGPVRQCSPRARFCDRLLFKSHSAPRPPQTPAASS